jgi:hypothetical protein
MLPCEQVPGVLAVGVLPSVVLHVCAPEVASLDVTVTGLLYVLLPLSTVGMATVPPVQVLSHPIRPH